MNDLTNNFVTSFKLIDTAARTILSDHAHEQLSERAFQRVDLSDFQIHAIEDDGIIYNATYNDACGCHPEPETASVFLPWEDIEYQIGEQPMGWADDMLRELQRKLALLDSVFRAAEEPSLDEHLKHLKCLVASVTADLPINTSSGKPPVPTNENGSFVVNNKTRE